MNIYYSSCVLLVLRGELYALNTKAINISKYEEAHSSRIIHMLICFSVDVSSRYVQLFWYDMWELFIRCQSLSSYKLLQPSLHPIRAAIFFLFHFRGIYLLPLTENFVILLSSLLSGPIVVANRASMWSVSLLVKDAGFTL